MIKKKHRAFGRIDSYRKYELFMERYRSAVDDFIYPHLANSNLKKPALVLDIGAGEGSLKYFCEGMNANFHAVEIWDYRIKICKDLGYKVWTFNIEKETFPFEDNSYDVVVASHVLEHLYNPEVTLKEIHRILKVGGIAVIGVPIHFQWVSKILYLIEKYLPAPEPDHHQFYSLKSLREFLKYFQIEDIRGFRMGSARKTIPIEDSYYFYKLSTWWGKKFPAYTMEVNAIVKK